MSEGTRLSLTEFEVLWRALELGEFPIVLDVPFHGGIHPEDRRRVAREVEDALRARRLWDARDGADARLAWQLGLLSRSAWSVDAWLLLDRPVRALGAVTGERGAVAVIDGPEITITETTSYRVIDHLVALAGIAPGPGESVSVPSEALDAATTRAGDDMQRLADALSRRGVPYNQADLLTRMCRNHRHLAQFGATVHDRTTGRKRSREVIALHATDQGWYLQLRRRGYVTITPATAAKLSAEIRQVLDNTHPRR